MKRVLFVVDEKRMGGVSILLEDMLHQLDLKKYHIDILVLHNVGEMFQNLPKEVRVISGTKYFNAVDIPMKHVLKSKNIKLIYRKLKLIFDMKTGFIKKKIVKERKKILMEEYDVEIAFKDGFTAIFTAYGDSKKKIHWLHYEYNKLNPNGNYPKLFFDVLPRFDKIVAVSKNVMNYFNKIYHLEDKTMVISNLIDENKIKSRAKEEINDKIEKVDGKIQFISVGRLHMQKGYARLLDVLKRLKEDKLLDHFILRIYGDGDQKELLQNKIITYGLESYVSLEGKRINPFPYVSNSDMFILSSIYEPFGLVIVEAMTLGIPVLATDNAATQEIINHEKNGYIVENSEEGLYQGLKKMIENPSLIKEYSEALLSYHYPIETIVKQIESILED